MADNPNFPTGTAVVNWFDSSGKLHVRVYSTDGYKITERCLDQPETTWVTGGFSQPATQVSATVWTASDGAHIRVYCTTDDATTEWCCEPNGGWSQGSYTTT